MSTNWLQRDKTWLWQIIGHGCLVLLRVPSVQISVSTLTGSLILNLDVLSTKAGLQVQFASVAVLSSVRATHLLHPILTGLDTPTGWPLGARVNHTDLGRGTGEILTQIWRGSHSLHQTPFVNIHLKYLINRLWHHLTPIQKTDSKHCPTDVHHLIWGKSHT